MWLSESVAVRLPLQVGDRLQVPAEPVTVEVAVQDDADGVNVSVVDSVRL